MPIRPENKDRYPDNWDEISFRIRFVRAGGRCECDGRCGRPPIHLIEDGRCPAEHMVTNMTTLKKYVLTTAHLDHVPEHCDDDNLMAMCQGCHLHYDKDHHAATRALTRARTIELSGQLTIGEGL